MANTDPLNLGGIAPPPGSTGTGQPRNETKASKSASDAPVGIPITYDPATQSYTSNWVPPMWIANQGPRARTADRPFDAKNDAGNDLPNVRSDGSRDWYRNSDVYAPGTLNPTQVQSIQERMVQAGLLDASNVHWGLWTAVDQNAYLTVLQQSNQYGVGASDMLNWLSQHPNSPTVQLANPIDVNAVADNVIPNVLGRKLSASEKADLVNAWHKTQMDLGQQQPSADGTTIDMPSLTDFATEYEKQQHPGDVAHMQRVTTLGWLHNALGPAATVETGISH